MTRKLPLLLPALLLVSGWLAAQPFYLRGEASPCDWGNSNSSCELTDPDGDGIYELVFDFGATPIGRKEFKIYNAGSDSWWPGSANSWFQHPGGSVTFRFDTSDNQVEAVEATAFPICAPGDFSGWNNAAAMTNTSGDTWCYTIPSPGTYQWKPTYCGAWDSWQPANGERNVNSNNWSVTTTSSDEQVCVSYDPATGRVTPPAPPTGYYLKGTAGPCDWNNLSAGCELEDPDGDGIYELVLDYGSTPIGRQEFKIYHALTDTWYPGGGNSWYIHAGGSVTFRFHSATGEVQAIDGHPATICAPGDFSGWNNAATMEDKGYGIWCYKVPTPGTYQWKPTLCGAWDSWQPDGSRNVGADNWSVTTTTPNEEVCVTYTLATGKVAAGAITAVPTLSQWGLILLFLLLANAGLLTQRRRQLVMAGIPGSQSLPWHAMPFDRHAFSRYLLLTGIGTALLFVLAVVLAGYSPTGADLPGCLLAIPLVAFLLTQLQREQG